MLYLSEIKDKKVITEDGIYVGKLNDIGFLSSETPTVTILHIHTEGKQVLNVPIQYLHKLNGQVVITKNYETRELTAHEIFAVRYLLDNQIIDIKENKVVRVNDVAIQDKPVLSIAGVDIGIMGILRWVNLEQIFANFLKFFKVKVPFNFVSWADVLGLDTNTGRVILKKQQKQMEKMRPEDLADYLEKINIKNVNNLLNTLDIEFAAEVIGNLNINYQNALFKQISTKRAATIIEFIDPDEAIDILLTLSKRRREQIIEGLPEEKKKEMHYLIDLSKTPIGEHINTEYVTVSPEDTTKQIIEMIKKNTNDFSTLQYIFVVNKQNQLIGVFSVYELLLQHSDTPAFKFLTPNVVVIHLTTPKDIAIKKMLKYKLQSIPVIDNNKRILGTVSFDDIAEFILDQYAE